MEKSTHGFFVTKIRQKKTETIRMEIICRATITTHPIIRIITNYLDTTKAHATFAGKQIIRQKDASSEIKEGETIEEIMTSTIETIDVITKGIKDINITLEETPHIKTETTNVTIADNNNNTTTIEEIILLEENQERIETTVGIYSETISINPMAEPNGEMMPTTTINQEKHPIVGRRSNDNRGNNYSSNRNY